MSVPAFLHSQIFVTPPIPDQDFTGTTFIVTGANGASGLDACKHFHRLNFSHLILACRSSSKAEAAKADIISAGIKSSTVISGWTLDMASYTSVLSFVDRCKNLQRIDGILLKAAVEMATFEKAG